MDVIALHRNGIPNAVCVMGTAFTKKHLELLNYYTTKNIILLFDGDDAGIKAADRTLKKLQKVTTDNLKVCLLSEKDPDEYISEFGVDSFKSYINNNLMRWEEYMCRNL